MRLLPFSRRAALAALVASCCAVAPALPAEEEVHLASGEVVTGELITETATSLEIRRQVLIKHNAVAANVTIAKEQITRRAKVAPFAEQYQVRAKSSPDTLEGHVALGRWAAEHCLVKEAAANAQRADDIDSDNPMVAKLFGDLGYVKIKEQWVREDEYLAKNGLVDFQGKIMTPAEADKAKAIYLANQEHDEAAQAIKDDEYYLAHGDEKVKELSDKLDKEKADAAKAKGDVTAAKARIDADNKKEADLANQQQNGNRNGGNNGNGGYGNRRNQQQQLTPAQQVAKDLADATAAYDKATEDQRAADRLVASDTRKLTALQAAVAKAKDDLPMQQERLKKADADILALTGKAPPAPPSDDKAAGDGKAGAKADATATTPAPAPKSRFGN